MRANSLLTDIDRVLFSAQDISDVITELGLKITRDYAGRRPLLVSVLRGGLIFLADLMRGIDLPLSIDFMAVSAYGPAVASGVVQVLKDLDELITGRDVIVVEDIIDTGLTLNYLLQILKAREPASLEVCTLLDKSVRRIANIHIAYKGFDIPDLFVVGFGLDLEQRYRNLPFIGVLKEELLVSS